MEKLIELRKYVDVLEFAQRDEVCKRIDQIFVCEMNDQKVGKFDLYSLADKDYHNGKTLMGVYHSNGYKYVSNRAILCKTKADYPKEFEERVVLPDGSLLPQEETRVPRFDSVIPADLSKYISIDVDFNKVAQWSKEAKVHKKNYGKSSVRFVEVYNDTNSSFDLFELFVKAMRGLNISQIMVHSDDRTKFFVAKNEETIMILCPSRQSVTNEFNEYVKWFKL